MKIEKQVHIKEDERKFLIKQFSKTEHWDRELLIYQWYGESTHKGEKKDKLIFDLLNYTVRYVAVTKSRTTATASDKKVDYFDISQFKLDDFVSSPFVLKRRSIKSGVHLDHFIYSNNICEYLLELENMMPSKEKLLTLGIILKEEVSQLEIYRNIKMCIPFQKSHAKFLQELLLQSGIY